MEMFEKILNEKSNPLKLPEFSGEVQHPTKEKLLQPVLFIFLGDEAAESYQRISARLKEKVGTPKGVAYLTVTSTEVSDSEAVSFVLPLPNHCIDEKSKRKQLGQHFLRDREALFRFNDQIRAILEGFLEVGYQNAGLVRVNLVTCAQDIYTVLGVDMACIIKHFFQEVFHEGVLMELYCFFQEGQRRSEPEKAELRATQLAFTHAWCKELEQAQSDSFSYTRPVEFIREGFSINAVQQGRLFHLVYLFSDKNSSGVIARGNIEEGYAAIVALFQLKNMTSNPAPGNDRAYNEYAFKLNCGDGAKGVYASGGLVSIKKPVKAIELFVIHSLLCFMETAGIEKVITENDLIHGYGVSADQVKTQIDFILSDCLELEHFNTILPKREIQAGELLGLSYEEAEEYYYEKGAEIFFRLHYEIPAWDKIRLFMAKNSLKERLLKDISHSERLGFLYGYDITDEEGLLLATLKKQRENCINAVAVAEEMLRRDLQEPVTSNRKKTLFGRGIPMEVELIRSLFTRKYGKKLEILKHTLQLILLEWYMQEIREVHRFLSEAMKRYQTFKESLRREAQQFLHTEHELSRHNLELYYHHAASKTFRQLLDKEPSFRQKIFALNLYPLVEKDPAQLFQKLYELCREYFFSSEEIMLSFDEELYHRSRFSPESGDVMAVLREEVFAKISESLTRQSKINLFLTGISSFYRHHENYFFSRPGSAFVEYALQHLAGQEGSKTKIGQFVDPGLDGMEMLCLVGGFTLEEVPFLRTCERYYERFLGEGYEFHVERPLCGGTEL